MPMRFFAGYNSMCALLGDVGKGVEVVREKAAHRHAGAHPEQAVLPQSKSKILWDLKAQPDGELRKTYHPKGSVRWLQNGETEAWCSRIGHILSKPAPFSNPSLRQPMSVAHLLLGVDA